MNRRGSGRTQNTGGNSPFREANNLGYCKAALRGLCCGTVPAPDESSHAGPLPDGRKKDRGASRGLFQYMNRRGSGRTQNTGGNSPFREANNLGYCKAALRGLCCGTVPAPDESSHAGPLPDGRKKDRGKNPRSSITARSPPLRRSGRSAEATRPAARSVRQRESRPAAS